MKRSLQIAGLVAWVVLGSAAARAQYDDPGPDPPPGEDCASGDVQLSTQPTNTWSSTQVNLNVGQTLCVRNNSSIPHNFHVLGVVRCAGTCSTNTSSSTTTPRGNWVSRLSFSGAGTLDFRCDEHASMGMTGQLVIAANDDSPGALSFTTSNFSVSEGAGNATITVRRTGGDDGAVSVQYATANGTATAGSDYTAKTGTLSWADNNDSNKSFTVAITNDTLAEPNETVLLSLSNPTGGATLGSPATATLTVNDNDGGGGGGGTTAPAAPSNLEASPVSTTEIGLAWMDKSTNETGFRIEQQPLGGTAFTEIATAAANATAFTAGGLTPESGYEFRVRATNSAGNSAYSNLADAATDTDDTGPCLEGPNTLCVNNERFEVEVNFRHAGGSGAGNAVPVPSAPDSGLFHFFGAGNIEMLLKVLNGCGVNNRYWVFFAATTNVEFTLTVTDTQSSRVRMYFNPLNRPAPPIQDVEAFATCP